MTSWERAWRVINCILLVHDVSEEDAVYSDYYETNSILKKIKLHLETGLTYWVFNVENVQKCNFCSFWISLWISVIIILLVHTGKHPTNDNNHPLLEIDF